MKRLFLLIFLILPLGHAFAQGSGNVLNILELGARNDGSEDISAIVNEYTSKGTIYLPAGIYRVDSPLKLQNPLRGDGYVRTSKVDPSVTWLISSIECSDGSVGVVEYTETTGINVEYINIKCNSREDGIRMKPCRQKMCTLISHVGIYNVEGCGIRVEGNGSRPAFIEDITIFGNSNLPFGSVGLIIEPADCRLVNIEAMGIQTGMEIRGGYTYGNNLHLWTGYMGKKDDGEWWKGTRGIVLSRYGIFCGSQIYPDTCFYPFEQREGNHGGFEITDLIYYDDGTEGGGKYLDGAFFHADEGATANLNIHGGFMALCGSDEKPLGMARMYTPGQNIDGVLVRTSRSICGKNIDILCLGNNLPEYTARYSDKGWCKVGDILDCCDKGYVKARIICSDGAAWTADIIRDGARLKVRFKDENTLCRKYKLTYRTDDGLVKLYLLTEDDSPLSIRFITESMNDYFRPVDYGSLRSMEFEPRYREVLPPDVM